MAFKLINAVEARSGSVIMVDGIACNVRSNDISKTGKHGHAKCRMEAVGVFTGKKKVITVPGHERFDVPLVVKKRGQVLSVGDDTVSVMDLESYETIDLPQANLEEPINEGDKVEYWEIEGKRIIKRKL